jgi:hypothetical protein
MKFLLTALLVASSAAAFAQSSSVGMLENIKGVVSVSSNGAVTSVTANTSLSNGNVVLNSGTGSSMVRFNSGCTVDLKANQVFTVNSEATCAALLASVKTVGAPAVAGGTSTLSPFLIAGGVIGGAVLIRNVTKNKASGS